jgi:hypothetical protein
MACSGTILKEVQKSDERMEPMKLLPLIIMLTLTALAAGTLSALAQEEPSSVHVDNALAGILDAFDSYPIVAIGDNHNVQQLGDFYIQLIQQQEFAQQVRNIVFEYGNAFYQDVIDRYVNGEDVPFEELQRVWTPTFAYGPSPVAQMYIDFYRAVREINAALPEGERLRVWLGDPPLNPDQPIIYSPNNPPPNRDEHFAGVVSRLISQGEKALVIIGAYHLVPTGFPFALPGEPGGPMIIGSPPQSGDAGAPPIGAEPMPMPVVPGNATSVPLLPVDLGSNVRQLLDAAYPDGRIFTITLFDGIADQACAEEFDQLAETWEIPTLVSLRDTTLADLLNRPDCRSRAASILPPDYQPAWADALLYLGKAEDLIMSPFEPDGPAMSYLEWIEQTVDGISFP